MEVSECKQGPIHGWCNWADVSDIAKGRVKCSTCAHRWSPVIALGGPMHGDWMQVGLTIGLFLRTGRATGGISLQQVHSAHDVKGDRRDTLHSANLL